MSGINGASVETHETSNTKHTLESIPLDDFLLGLEKWIHLQELALKNLRKPQNERDDSIKLDAQRLPSMYIDFVTKKFEGLDSNTKENITDVMRHKALELYRRLFDLQKVREGIDRESLKVKGSVNSLLTMYSFYDFTTLSEFTKYLHDNESSSSWNDDMLMRFISKLRKFAKTTEEKKIHFSMLFRIPGVKVCHWNEQMLVSFSQVLKEIQGTERHELRDLFNALPNIQAIPFHHREHKCWKILNSKKNPEKSGTHSFLANLPGRAGVVRYPSV